MSVHFIAVFGRTFTTICTSLYLLYPNTALNFASGSAVIDSTSMNEVKNISEILKAFPAVNIKVGGYTDNTGDDAANLKLSSERAAAVKAALVWKGIATARLESEGYGSHHPIASNDNEEGRKQNNRIAISVRQK